MSSEEQNILGNFLILTQPRFVRTLREDAYEFLSICTERLQNLGLVELHGVGFVAYELDTAAKRWLRGYLDSRIAGSPPKTWTQFS